MYVVKDIISHFSATLALMVSHFGIGDSWVHKPRNELKNQICLLTLHIVDGRAGRPHLPAQCAVHDRCSCGVPREELEDVAREQQCAQTPHWCAQVEARADRVDTGSTAAHMAQ